MRINDEHLAPLAPTRLRRRSESPDRSGARGDSGERPPLLSDRRGVPDGAERYPNVAAGASFPSSATLSTTFATHPELASFAERVIGTKEILLTQAILWGSTPGSRPRAVLPRRLQEQHARLPARRGPVHADRHDPLSERRHPRSWLPPASSRGSTRASPPRSSRPCAPAIGSPPCTSARWW